MTTAFLSCRSFKGSSTRKLWLLSWVSMTNYWRGRWKTSKPSKDWSGDSKACYLTKISSIRGFKHIIPLRTRDCKCQRKNCWATSPKQAYKRIPWIQFNLLCLLKTQANSFRQSVNRKEAEEQKILATSTKSLLGALIETDRNTPDWFKTSLTTIWLKRLISISIEVLTRPRYQK
jgi:hypothetical protein